MWSLISSIIFLVAATFAIYQYWLSKRRSTSRALTPPAILEKVETVKEFGKWDPITYVYPKVEPWLDFDVEATKPIPFRPFRWGPNYPINMGIRPMGWDHWIELDSDYCKTHAIRLERTTTQKELATRTLPGFRPQAFECLVEMASFLALRYPHYFTVKRTLYEPEKEETWGESLSGKEAGCVRWIENKITGEAWDFEEIETIEGKEWNPMRIAGLLMQDDLAVMCEDENGEYCFQAGSICTAGFWRLEDKVGRTLDYIHASGAVPSWKTKLKFSMERFFQKLKVDKPVQRNNYFFQIDDQLAWSSNTNGPEKIFDQAAKGPFADQLADSEDPSWKEPAPTNDFNDIWFRTERQTLRRMPRTGCILFTIRTYFHKVSDIASEPGVPGRMASAIRSWPDEVSAYKGAFLYKDILLPSLDELHEEQVKSGLEFEDGIVKGGQGGKYPF